jgi:hypothetical protein
MSGEYRSKQEFLLKLIKRHEFLHAGKQKTIKDFWQKNNMVAI